MSIRDTELEKAEIRVAAEEVGRSISAHLCAVATRVPLFEGMTPVTVMSRDGEEGMETRETGSSIVGK